MLDAAFHTLLLAKFFGLYFVIMAIIMASRSTLYREMIANMKATSGSVFFGASFMLMLSILLVLVHSHWDWEPRLLVTIVVYLLFIKSVLWLAFPECMMNCAKKVYGGCGYWIAVIVLGLVGVLLMMKGFHMHVEIWPF